MVRGGDGEPDTGRQCNSGTWAKRMSMAVEGRREGSGVGRGQLSQEPAGGGT